MHLLMFPRYYRSTDNVFPNPYQVIQLRKACSHPYLFTGMEPEPYEEGEHLVQVIENLKLLSTHSRDYQS